MKFAINIPFTYRGDPIDPDSKAINYQKTTETTQEDFSKGIFLHNLMDDISRFLAQSVPQDAVIEHVANTDVNQPSSVVIEGYDRHDDFLAKHTFNNQTTVLLDNSVATPAQENQSVQTTQLKTKEKSTKPVQMENNMTEDNISEDNTKSDDTSLPSTPCFVTLRQKGKSHGEPYNITKDKIPEDAILCGIADTAIKEVPWLNAKDIVFKNAKILFNNDTVVGLVPSNFSLTDTQYERIAKESEEDVNDLKDKRPLNLGTIKGTKTSYKLIAFVNKNEKLSSELQEKEEKPKMSESQQNIFADFVPNNNNKATQPAPQQALSTPSNNNWQNSQPQSNNQTQSISSINVASDKSPFNEGKDSNDVFNGLKYVNQRIDTIIKKLDAYQKTADDAYTVAMLANEVDTKDLSPKTISWIKEARSQGENGVANAVVNLVGSMNNKQNLDPEMQKELSDVNSFLQIIRALVHVDYE